MTTIAELKHQNDIVLVQLPLVSSEKKSMQIMYVMSHIRKLVDVIGLHTETESSAKHTVLLGVKFPLKQENFLYITCPCYSHIQISALYDALM